MNLPEWARKVVQMYCDIRSWLVDISHSVKLNYYCKIVCIDPANLTKFIKGYDRAVHIEKLVQLVDVIRSDLSEKIG